MSNERFFTNYKMADNIEENRNLESFTNPLKNLSLRLQRVS